MDACEQSTYINGIAAMNVLFFGSSSACARAAEEEGQNFSSFSLFSLARAHTR